MIMIIIKTILGVTCHNTEVDGCSDKAKHMKSYFKFPFHLVVPVVRNVVKKGKKGKTTHR